MAQYKDTEHNTWYCKFYYQNWTEERKQKLKRGFPTKREAAAWERDFLERQQGTPDMTFKALYDLYIEDISGRLKDSTVKGRKYRCERQLLPYFKEKPINQITASDIRKWQNIIAQSGLKETYQRALHEQLSIILNYAVKYYRLPYNPCRAAGPIGKKDAHRMDFWTQDNFNSFILHITRPDYKAAFTTLFYTGLRCGELLALTRSDINLEAATVSITKTYYEAGEKEKFTSPKTSNSIRTVTLPTFLVDCLSDYINCHYVLNPYDRLFPFTRRVLDRTMKKACSASNIKKIRLHDIRHSHVSLLIEMGFPPLLIAERIGDTVDMVNNIYGHLYPNRHKEVADKLHNLVSK